MEYIEVAKIVNTHALKGEVKLESYTDFDRFKKGNILYCGKEHIELKVKSHRVDKGFDYVTFEGYEDINLILPFKGKMLQIKETDLDPLGEDEYYIRDLKNKDVYNEDGKYIGKVVYVSEYPQNFMLEIDTGEKIALVPFRKEFIVEVSDKIIIHEIEGLI